MTPAPDVPHESRSGFSRRSFLKGAGGMAAGGALGDAAAGALSQEDDVVVQRGTQEIELAINGVSRKVRVEPRTTLLSALRERLDAPLTGSKLVCNQGNCGACTVLLDGRPAYACMQLACDLEGLAITTVEGLERDGELSAVQRAFVTEDALMCGFCTPGFVMSVTSCLSQNPDASEAEVRAACSGNLCRCGTYPHIWRAAERARGELAGPSRGREGGAR